MGVVYKHNVPNGKCYIGITKLSLNNRFKHGKGYKRSTLFYRAILKYGWDNIKTEILFESDNYDLLLNKEEYYIKKYQSNNKNLGYNIESGGTKGALGLKRSRKTLEKMRQANLGKIMPNEVKEKISKSLKGRKFTEEHSKKKSLSQTGEKNHRYNKKASAETKKKMSESQRKGKDHEWSVKVVQMDLDGNFLKVWDSFSEIKKELGFHHSTISDCCRGKQKQSKGYKWKYYEK